MANTYLRQYWGNQWNSFMGKAYFSPAYTIMARLRDKRPIYPLKYRAESAEIRAPVWIHLNAQLHSFNVYRDYERPEGLLPVPRNYCGALNKHEHTVPRLQIRHGAKRGAPGDGEVVSGPSPLVRVIAVGGGRQRRSRTPAALLLVPTGTPTPPLLHEVCGKRHAFFTTRRLRLNYISRDFPSLQPPQVERSRRFFPISIVFQNLERRFTPSICYEKN